MNLDWLKALPIYQKFAAIGLVAVIIVALFFYFLYIPKNNQIAALQTDIAKLQNDISVNDTKARRLDELTRENAELERQLAEKKEQLPPEAEIASLLKQVSDLGLRTGLDFKLWKPGAKKSNESGLYAEIPVDVEVAGGYHTTAMFFDRISKLPRIVNIGDLHMSTPKAEKGRLVVQTTFVATAFAAVKEAAEKPDAKKAKPVPKKDAKPKAGGEVGG